MANKVPRQEHRKQGPTARRVLTHVNPSKLWYAGGHSEDVKDYHDPYFLAVPTEGRSGADLRQHLVNAMESGDQKFPADKVQSIGPVITTTSFSRTDEPFEAIPIYLTGAWEAKDVSTELFKHFDCDTLEHDIPYKMRVLADLAADGDAWLLDTKGKDATLRILCYDIEKTKYKILGEKAPVDILGWATFNVTINSHVDLGNEDIEINIIEAPESYMDPEVHGIKAVTPEEEVELLHKFIQLVKTHDIVAAHNGIGYDNKEMRNRIEFYIRKAKASRIEMPDQVLDEFEDFVRIMCEKDRLFLWGEQLEGVVMAPMTFDTFHIAKKVYFYFKEHNLKFLAKAFGCVAPDRSYVAYDDLDIDDERTMKYAMDDVREQIGVTLTMLPQALSLTFLCNLQPAELFSGGNTTMWDHMALIRAAYHGRAMPAKCRASHISEQLHYMKLVGATRKEIRDDIRARLQRGQDVDQEILRVAKQGIDMPEWLEYAHGMYDYVDITDDKTGAVSRSEKPLSVMDVPGGMTVKPTELNSQFIPWWNVIEADVGAMYPQILKGLNSTADTVRIAKKGETPDNWVWLYTMGRGFDPDKYEIRRPTAAETFACKDGKPEGWMVGVLVNEETGMVGLAMDSILNYSRVLKANLAEAKKIPNNQKKVGQLKDLYQGSKAARNAGTHGILSPEHASCRQFNIMAGALIPTQGQVIISDVMNDFKARGFRVTYVDTDGVHVASSRSAYTNPRLAEHLPEPEDPDMDGTLVAVEDIKAAIEEASNRWKVRLNNPDFELEAEEFDCVFLHSHKNYGMLKLKRDTWEVSFKGNNFKASDKAAVAKNMLNEVVLKAMMECRQWTDEGEARHRFQAALKAAYDELVTPARFQELPEKDLIMTQQVQPKDSYKRTAAGAYSKNALRTVALERLLGEEIRQPIRMNFVVCQGPLEGLEPKTKAAQKPIEFMFPVEELGGQEIDFGWYMTSTQTYLTRTLNIGAHDKVRTKQLDFSEGWLEIEA